MPARQSWFQGILIEADWGDAETLTGPAASARLLATRLRPMIAAGVNLLGVIHGISAFVPRLLDQGRPSSIVASGNSTPDLATWRRTSAS